MFLLSLFRVVNQLKNLDKKTWQGPTARTKPQGQGPDFQGQGQGL